MKNAKTNFSKKIELDILLTTKCNLNCKHCLYREKGDSDDLPYELFLNLLEDLEDNTELHLLGGEPLCRDDINKIISVATKQKKYTQILTNGYSADKDTLQDLKDAGLKEIGFSIDGTKEIHNSNRGRDDSFERVIKAISEASRLGYEPKVSTALYKDNKESIFQLILKLNELDLKRMLIEYVLPLGKGEQLKEKVIKPEEWLSFIEKLSKFKKEKDISLPIVIQKVFSKKSANSFDCTCTNGKYPVIDAFGNYYPCILLYAARYPLGNIKEDSFNKLNSNKSISSFINRIQEEYSSSGEDYPKNLCPALKIMIQKGKLSLKNLDFSEYTIGCFHDVSVI
ncbi:MAG: radical SAM/SPASM domain-containing protein [Elusimicrobiota bacterium]